jgi:hypothetical protein
MWSAILFPAVLKSVMRSAINKAVGPLRFVLIHRVGFPFWSRR